MIDFPSHIYKYLFENKGEFKEGWVYLQEDDFKRQHIPKNWDKYLNLFGEGTKFLFLLKCTFFVSWSPKKYVRHGYGEFKLSSGAFQEKLSFSFARTPC